MSSSPVLLRLSAGNCGWPCPSPSFADNIWGCGQPNYECGQPSRGYECGQPNRGYGDYKTETGMECEFQENGLFAVRLQAGHQTVGAAAAAAAAGGGAAGAVATVSIARLLHLPLLFLHLPAHLPSPSHTHSVSVGRQAFFFVLYMIFAAFLVLNLFIGIITTEMAEVRPNHLSAHQQLVVRTLCEGSGGALRK